MIDATGTMWTVFDAAANLCRGLGRWASAEVEMDGLPGRNADLCLSDFGFRRSPTHPTSVISDIILVILSPINGALDVIHMLLNVMHADWTARCD